MQANKNGFFYVLDRITGEFISAQPFSRVTWAKGIDQKTMTLQYFETLKSLGAGASTKYIFPMEFTGLLESFIKSRGDSG